MLKVIFYYYLRYVRFIQKNSYIYPIIKHQKLRRITYFIIKMRHHVQHLGRYKEIYDRKNNYENGSSTRRRNVLLSTIKMKFTYPFVSLEIKTISNNMLNLICDNLLITLWWNNVVIFRILS